MSVLLIKNADVYAPEPSGKRDVLCVNGSIVKIALEIKSSEIRMIFSDADVIDASGMLCVPGIVDMHVHFNGAGGEGCPQFRTPPTQLSEFTRAGITTAVGLLGTDGITRSLSDLYMKARGLQNEGISTWIWTGAYQIPSPTITGNVPLDIAVIDKVVGLKIAYSDHRSSHPGDVSLIETISSSRVGGIVGGKSGKVMIHMGIPANGLSKLREVLSHTEVPLSQLIPTHLNRSEAVFTEAIEYGKAGGNVDLSTGVSERYYFKGAVKPSTAVRRLMESEVPIERITMSSDGNGSMAVAQSDGSFKMLVSPVKSMYEEFVDMMREGVAVADACRIVSSNSADMLGLPLKGKIKVGADADLLLISSEDFSLNTVFAKGKKMVENGNPIVFGVFENS